MPLHCTAKNNVAPPRPLAHGTVRSLQSDVTRPELQLRLSRITPLLRRSETPLPRSQPWAHSAPTAPARFDATAAAAAAADDAVRRSRHISETAPENDSMKHLLVTNELVKRGFYENYLHLFAGPSGRAV